jgi:hypothetical protein
MTGYAKSMTMPTASMAHPDILDWCVLRLIRRSGLTPGTGFSVSRAAARVMCLRTVTFSIKNSAFRYSQRSVYW